MMASSINILKADSVLRLSTFLKRWKPAWLVLYGNGELRYFESKDDYVAKATINVPRICREILSGHRNIDPPKDRSSECIFGLRTDESNWYFCAQSPDDAVVWRLALSEVKGMSIPRYRVRMPPPEAPPPGYTDGTNYYQYACPAETTVPLYQASGGMREVPIIYRGSDGEYIMPRQIIEHPDGSRTIILGDGNEIPCHCRHGYYCGCGYGFGDAALLGLAAGTLMWSPFLWSPFFWC
ncbi:unnamed protein product [Schistosoma spindalis]|nr:unnamed protein product [Schistosoma spindale]